MARTESTMLELGTLAPEFTLPEPATGRRVSLSDFQDSKALLVAFICNHCPYVKHLRKELAKFADDYGRRGLQAVAINANDADHYPADAPPKMIEEIEIAGYRFPYLYDEDQSVAKAYRASCTPDFFLFDAKRALSYRGRFDASTPGNNLPVTGADLRQAADSLLAGQPVSTEQFASMGCSIKWRAGRKPAYFA